MKRLIVAMLALAAPAFAQEGKLIATLKSDAPMQAKADACRELARYGTKAAVPVLARLLPDQALSHMARYALEPIADPSVDAALRRALSQTNGRLLEGVITSIGVRKDQMAVGPLAQRLSSSDPGVAQAAARALGSIGADAAPALEEALGAVAPANRPAVCEGLLRCAEAMPAGRAAAAYDRVRATSGLPTHVRDAALLGSMRSRGRAGIPLILRTIRTDSLVSAAGAMRISQGISGPDFTRALAAELPRAGKAKQVLLAQTLGNRGDRVASPALEASARHGSPELRIASIRSLAQLAGPSSLPILIALAKDADAGVAAAALAGLTGFPDAGADAAAMALLADRAPATRIAGIEMAVRRRIALAAPALVKAARDSDAGVSVAAFRALGEMAGPSQVAGMVAAMLSGRSVADAEAALLAVCTRQSDPAPCVAKLLPALSTAQGEPKLALLRILGALGGPQALAAVREATGSSVAEVSETATRALCAWPTADATPHLARLAATTSNAKTRVLAVRGLLRLIPTMKAPDAAKLSQLEQALALIERNEERAPALAALGRIPTVRSLELVTPYLTGDALTEEAAVAAVAIGEKIVGASPGEVAEAMRLIRTSDSQLTGRIQRLLVRVPKGAVEAGFKSIFNGIDLSGWEGKDGWWTVEEGALSSESTPAKPCTDCNYLMWRGGKPADFELRASFRLSEAANSGIQIRTEERPNWDTFGYQADMTGDGALVGFVYHHSRGLIAGRGEDATFAADGAKTVTAIGDPATLLKRFRQGDWNSYRVVCRGPEISLFVNGILMCHINDRHATEAAKSGVIALQMHPGPPMKVQFKDVRMREFR